MANVNKDISLWMETNWAWLESQSDCTGCSQAVSSGLSFEAFVGFGIVSVAVVNWLLLFFCCLVSGRCLQCFYKHWKEEAEGSAVTQTCCLCWGVSPARQWTGELMQPLHQTHCLRFLLMSSLFLWKSLLHLMQQK